MHQFKETCTDEAELFIRDTILEDMCRRYLALMIWALDHPYGLIGSKKEKDIQSYRDYFRSEVFIKLETVHDGEWFITELDKEAKYIHLKKIEYELRQERRKKYQERKRSKKIWKQL